MAMAATAGYANCAWNLADGGLREQTSKTSVLLHGIFARWRAWRPGFSTGQVSLWNAATGERKAEMKEHTSVVYAVAFSPDGKTLVCPGDHTVRLWSAADGKLLKR
jgi:WD40 repeat protein